MQNYLHPITSFEVDCYDEIPLWSAPFGLQLLEKVNYRKGITALDIGFGNGFPLTELAMRLGQTSVVYGIDPWEEAIKRTRKKIECYEIKNIRIIKGIAESIPLESGSIDLVTSNNGINNVKDMETVFDECSRILRQGGQFIQTMNLDKSMVEFYNELENILEEMGMRNEIDMLHRHIYDKRKPLDEVIGLLEKHGFIIKSIDQYQFSYRFTDATAMLNHYFIRLAFMGAWKAFLPAQQIAGIFSKVEDNLNKQADLNGGFTLSIPFVVIDASRK